MSGNRWICWMWYSSLLEALERSYQKEALNLQVRTNNITYRDPIEIAEVFLSIIVKFPIPAMSVIRMFMVVLKKKFRIIS